KASREGTAKAPLPRKAILNPASLLPVVASGLLAQLALEQVALEGGEAVHEQEAVDVVDLVAEGPRQQVRALVGALLAVRVQALHHHPCGAHGRAAEPRHREAALLVALLALAQDQLG